MARADAVCSAYAAAASSLQGATAYAQVVAYANHNLPLYAAALGKLEALKPPPQDAAAVKRWLAADRSVETAVRSLGLAAQRHDFQAVTNGAAQVQQAEIASRRAAASLGLKVCGSLTTG
ncbi:MAG: hypothetical protein ACYDCH_09210 [Gaiellaceae bacterium]